MEDYHICSVLFCLSQSCAVICTHAYEQFLPVRCYPGMVHAVFMCLSICLSQVGVLLRPLNLESRKQRRTIA